jgi:sugar/nucleoside kinase (ribokinase family)
MPRILCIGSAHIDENIHANGKKDTVVGGVVYNVAQLLNTLGNQVDMLTILGTDAAGDKVQAAIEVQGMSSNLVFRSHTAKTAVCVSTFDERGTMVSSVPELEIYTKITVAMLQPHVAQLKEADFLVMDSTLPAAVNQYIADVCKGKDLHVVICAIPEIPNILGVLKHAKSLFGNAEEICHIGAQQKNVLGIHQSLLEIANRGVKNTFCTFGASGVHMLAHNSRAFQHFPAIPAANMKCEICAGDSLAAATIHHWHATNNLNDAVKEGLKAAHAQITGNALPPRTFAAFTKYFTPGFALFAVGTLAAGAMIIQRQRPILVAG